MTFLSRLTKFIIGGADQSLSSDHNHLSQPFTFDDDEDNVARYSDLSDMRAPQTSVLTDTSELSDDEQSQSGILSTRNRSLSVGKHPELLRLVDEDDYAHARHHECYSPMNVSSGGAHVSRILKQHARYMEMAKSKVSSSGANFAAVHNGSAPTPKAAPEPLFSEILLLSGHTNVVTKVIKIDEERVLTYSDDATLIIWQVHTGRMLKRLVGHKNRITCALVMMDSTFGGSHSHTESATSFTSVDSGVTSEVQSSGITPGSPAGGTPNSPTHLTTHHYGTPHPTTNLSQHPNSNFHHLSNSTMHQQFQNKRSSVRIISGSADKTVRIWDADTGICIKELKEHRSGVNCLCKLEKNYFCSVSDEICIWDLQGNAKSKIERRDLEHVHDVLPLPNNQIVAASSVLTVYDVNGEEDLEPKFPMDQDPDIFALLKVTPETFVTASRNGILSFWSQNSLQCVEKLNLRNYFKKPESNHKTQTHLTHVTLANRYFLLCAFGKHFAVVHHATRKPVLIAEDAHDTTINKVIYLSGRNLLATCSDDSRIRLWKTHQTMSLSSNSGTMSPSSRRPAYQNKKSNSKTSLLTRRITRKRSRSVESHQPIFFQNTDIVVAQLADELLGHTDRCVDILKLNDSELVSVGGDEVLVWRDGAVARHVRQLYAWRFGTGQYGVE